MAKLKILITGEDSQLSKQIIRDLENDKLILKKHQKQVFAFDKHELDITNKENTIKVIKQISPDILINCASYNKVDDAENNEDIAMRINALAPSYLAMACKEVNSYLIHFSTDYVFDGLNLKAYVETDKPNPINIYGKSKSIGENNIREIHEKSAVIRTSWLYSEFENNFATTIIKKLFKNEELKVVDDQIGNPTNIYELSNQLESIINNEICGIIHCSSEGETSWYCYAKKIAELINIKANISPIKTEQLSRLAKRPKYSSLQNKVLNDNKINEMSQWENALEKFIINYIK